MLKWLQLIYKLNWLIFHSIHSKARREKARSVIALLEALESLQEKAIAMIALLEALEQV